MPKHDSAPDERIRRRMPTESGKVLLLPAVPVLSMPLLHYSAVIDEVVHSHMLL